MQSEFYIEGQDTIDSLIESVFSMLENNNFKIVPQAGARYKTRSIDFSFFDLVYVNKKFGRFEYRLKKDSYQVIVDIDKFEVYAAVVDVISNYLSD